jgi:hypothetical protein
MFTLRDRAFSEEDEETTEECGACAAAVFTGG